MNSFSKKDLFKAIKECKINIGDTVIVRADLRYLGRYQGGSRKLPADLFDCIGDLINFPDGTIVVPTATISLCNTQKVFDINKTPSEMGAFSEYVRKQNGAIRSLHPFLSYTAIGKSAKSICEKTARHGFGPETPKDRLIAIDAKALSVGIPIRYSCTTVHHAEFTMGVPYRYVKEFFHPIVLGTGTKKEYFYLYVWYRECDLKRDHNAKILSGYTQYHRTEVGTGQIASYPVKHFYQHCVRCLKDDIYCWLKERPHERPFQK